MNSYYYNLSATTINTVSLISPAHITFNPAYIQSLHGYEIAKIVYNFGDSTPHHTVYTSNSSNACDVTVSHNFFKSLSADPTTIAMKVSAYEFTTFACRQYNINVRLVLPTYPVIDFWPLEIRAFDDKLLVVSEMLDPTTTNAATRQTYTFANIIVPASATDYQTTTLTNSCVDPTPLSNFTVTVTATPQPVYGATVATSAASGTLVFVSDQGNYNSVYYASVAAAINTLTADGYLFGGNNNYPRGEITSVDSNWSGYSTLLGTQKVYPALGVRDLCATVAKEIVNSIVLLEGETWRYSLSSNDPQWYSVGYDDSLWLSGSTPLGYSSGGFLGTQVASTHPLSAYCNGCEILPVTDLYARTTFTTTSADFITTSSVRLRYKYNDAIAIFVNGSQVATDNIFTPYTSAPVAVCERSSALGAFTTVYLPTSSLNIGSNTIAIHTIQHSNNSNSLFFDAEVATVCANNVLAPSTYGCPQVQKFSHLPGNRRYYDVVLPGDVHLFVLNSGINSNYPCRYCVEPDGFAIGSPQYQWLIDMILNSTSRWKVVMFHMPYLGSTTNSDYFLFTDFDWGFESLGVNLVLNGSLGINEHCIRGKVHYVNCSANTCGLAAVTSISEEAVWTDIVENNNSKGLPAVVNIVASQSDMSVSFLRASSLEIIHTFKIV